MNLQILVTTMHQTDLSKTRQMKIKGNVLIANQADCYSYCRQVQDGYTVEMVTTPTRGTSKNRNIALVSSGTDAEYLMFSDDDLIFKDDYKELIAQEFRAHPDAEAIKFSLRDVFDGQVRDVSPVSFQRATRRSVASGGVCGLVIRRDVLIRNNLRFHENFGPGTANYCGEDTIFLQELLKEKVKFYLSPVKIADIDQTRSTWYEGYTERYFRSAGMVIAEIYPHLAWLLAVRSAYRFSRRADCDMKFPQILSYYWQGIRKHKAER